MKCVFFILFNFFIFFVRKKIQTDTQSNVEKCRDLFL